MDMKKKPLKRIPWNKGKKTLVESTRKMVETRMKNGSYFAWNKGKKGVQNAWNKGIPHSDITKNKISNANKGKIAWNNGRKENREEVLEKQSIAHKGHPAWNKGLNRISDERIKKSIKIGENHWNWKGGKTTENHKIRTSLENRLWREAVFKRDDYQCIWGGKEHGNKLNADHIKPFAYFPELRFAIDNGRTLCVDCHRKTETWGTKKIA